MFSMIPPFVYSDSNATKFASVTDVSAKLTESAVVLFATLPILKSSLPVVTVL